MSKQSPLITPYHEISPATPSTQPESVSLTTMVNPSQIQRPALQRNVPAFLNKLYNMVDDPSSDDLIRWSDEGTSFIVLRHEEFARKVLPQFFKHSNFSSFVRQLNMYGFHKVPHLQQGVLQNEGDSEHWEFDNPHFQRNQPDLLLLVTRKKGRDTDEKDMSSIDLPHILEEIQAIKKHQMNISSHLKNIQRDNQVLWQETINARERHHRHQETIDKILRFLASVFSGEKQVAIPSRKRQYLLEAAEANDDEGNEERPAKILRKSPSPLIDESNVQTSKTESSPISSANPSSVSITELLPSTSSSPYSLGKSSSKDLADAIALNNPTMPRDTTLIPQSQLQEATQGMNSQELQNLQNLISLAQSNPAILSQLTDYSLLYPSTNTLSLDYPALDPNSLSTTRDGATRSADLTPQAPSLPEVTNNIASLSRAADSISQDIDALGSNIDSLADQLGFDPATYTGDDDLNLDEFLNTYGQSSSTPASPKLDASNTTTNTSPSPSVESTPVDNKDLKR